MDARFLGFDNIAATLGLNTAKNLQAWYNEYLEGRETMGLNIDGFDWADPQLDFTYEFLEADGRIKAMATYVAPDSEPLARGKDVSLAKLTGTIPRQKRKIVRGENDYRRELIALQEADVKARFRGDSPVDSVRNYLATNLFDTLAEIPDSHNASVTYQVGQMTSKRKLVLTADNNQGGIIGAEFSSNVPEENVTKEDWYTVGENGAITYVEGTNPIMAIKKKVRAIKRDLYNGYPMVKAKMSAFTFDALIEHPETLRALGYALRPELYASAKNDADALKVGTNAFYSNSHEYMVDFFKRAIDVDELVIDNTIVGVDKLNTSTKKFEQKKVGVFDDGIIMLSPTGIIGSIHNVVPLRPDGQAIVAGIFGNRGILEYRYNREARTQTWVSELTVLAVPNAPKKLFYFEVQGVTSTGA
jgi:hypothetical protein